tara:strand:- start:284 stop:481 length:198 start_codon:yes stop_codon:yes gene_type:complete
MRQRPRWLKQTISSGSNQRQTPINKNETNRWVTLETNIMGLMRARKLKLRIKGSFRRNSSYNKKY